MHNGAETCADAGAGLDVRAREKGNTAKHGRGPPRTGRKGTIKCTAAKGDPKTPQ